MTYLAGFVRTLLLVASILGATAASAEIITFDDIDGSSYPNLGVGYHGLDWGVSGKEIHALNATNYCSDCGYRNNMVSADNVAFNWNGDQPRDITMAAGTFTLNGGWWGAAWGNQSLRFEGYNDGVLLYSSDSYAVTTLAPIYVGLNWAGIDQFRIIGTGDWWVLDDLEINGNAVPEPGMLGLFALSMLGLFATRRRR